MALRIKQLRQSKGWSQETLAAKANLSRTHLTMIENETRPANTLRLNAIAAALGVAPEELFETDDRERAIIQIMRMLASEDANALLRVAEGLAAKPRQEE